MKQRRLDNSRGILMLWLNWMAGGGTLVFLCLMSLWCRPNVMPLVAFGLQGLLFVVIRKNRTSRVPYCLLLPFITSRVLFWTGVTMLVVNLLYSDWLVNSLFDAAEINPDIPFITMLIISPVTAIISGWGYVYRKNISFCRDCRMRYGTPAERGFLGTLFTQESNFQTGMLFTLSAILTFIGWGYYFLFYVNAYLNALDQLIFLWLPALLWIASVIYLGMRSLGIWGYYCQDVDRRLRPYGFFTRVRYILIWDNYICLREPTTDVDYIITPETKLDTPAVASMSYRDVVEDNDARVYLYNACGLKDIDIRKMYSNTIGNVDYNIFHYICFLSDAQKEEFTLLNPDCHWYTISEIAELINSCQVNPIMASEIVRLHTVITAWQKYLPNGHRRYKIEHYSPAFNIRDIYKFDVDYNDTNWLHVADNNQDTPFYYLRKFWRKYINGVGK